jgi:hypothetical protein
MYYQEQNNSSVSFGVWSWILTPLLIYAALIAASLVPSLPKGYLLGHEFGAPNVRYPGRLPIIRPLYLKRGERVQISYSTKIRAGRLKLTLAYSPAFTPSLIAAADETVLSFSATAQGDTHYTSLKDGYYRFGILAEHVPQGEPKCTDIFTDSLNALLVNRTTCPLYNTSYAIMIE